MPVLLFLPRIWCNAREVSVVYVSQSDCGIAAVPPFINFP